MKLWLLIFVIGAAHAQDAPAPAAAPPIRVLFVGNSLTYTNDLPGVVAALAAQSASRKIEAANVTFPSWSLRMHWESGKALRVIQGEHWDFVVLQPGAAADGQKVIELFDGEIRKVGARTILMIVSPRLKWRPPADFYERQERIASALGILNAPAGPAWSLAVEDGIPQMSLYDVDGIHPSIVGTYLTACVIYSVITGMSPEGLRPRWAEGTGAPDTATLNSAAWHAVQKAQRGPGPASSPT